MAIIIIHSWCVMQLFVYVAAKYTNKVTVIYFSWPCYEMEINWAIETVETDM